MTKHRPRIIPWEEIEKLYLAGVPSGQLIKDYKVNANTFYQHISVHKLAQQKNSTSGLTLKKIKEECLELAPDAIKVFKDILKDKLAKDTDRMAAARFLLTFPGLEKQKPKTVVISNDQSIQYNITSSDQKQIETNPELVIDIKPANNQ